MRPTYPVDCFALHVLGRQNSIPEFRSTRVAVVLARDRCPGHEQELLAPCHRDVEQPALIFDSALVPPLISYRILRDEIPDRCSANLCRRKPIAKQRRYEHHGPLHAFGLVDRHYAHRVWRCILIILPSFGICILSAILKEISKGHVLLIRTGMEMDVLEVGNELRELPKVVEENFTAGIWDSFLSYAEGLNKLEIYPLNRVERPPLLRWLRESVSRFLCSGESGSQRRAGGANIRLYPCGTKGLLITPAGDEVE
jgi:hypothetical protein